MHVLFQIINSLDWFGGENAAVDRSPRPESEEASLLTMEEWHQYLEKRKRLGEQYK